MRNTGRPSQALRQDLNLFFAPRLAADPQKNEFEIEIVGEDLKFLFVSLLFNIWEYQFFKERKSE